MKKTVRVSVDPKRVVDGLATPMRITIENKSDGPLSSLRLQLDTEGELLIVDGSPRIDEDRLLPGESTTRTLNVVGSGVGHASLVSNDFVFYSGSLTLQRIDALCLPIEIVPRPAATARSNRGRDGATDEMAPLVFVSYCRENKSQVRRLVVDLERAEFNVHWDELIKGGEDFNRVIRSAIRSSKAVVLCLSKELASRKRSGVYPEILQAISIARELRPGTVFLIPIRLNECDVPDIEIGELRQLSDLHYIDLFPDYSLGVKKLCESIRSAVKH